MLRCMQLPTKNKAKEFLIKLVAKANFEMQKKVLCYILIPKLEK